MRSAGGVPFLSTLCDLDTINFAHALTGYLMTIWSGNQRFCKRSEPFILYEFMPEKHKNKKNPPSSGIDFYYSIAPITVGDNLMYFLPLWHLMLVKIWLLWNRIEQTVPADLHRENIALIQSWTSDNVTICYRMNVKWKVEYVTCSTTSIKHE